MLFILSLANRGIEMSSLPVSVLASELLAATLFFLALNFIKVPIFSRLSIA
jgi:H+-transporting ATPase